MHFSTGKKQDELKVLIMAHRCQIRNKKKFVLKKNSSIGGERGVWAIEEISSFFDFTPDLIPSWNANIEFQPPLVKKMFYEKTSFRGPFVIDKWIFIFGDIENLR